MKRALRRRYAPKRFRIVHTIREGSDPRPVVQHIFFGSTHKEAESIYAAHKKTDKFLRGCDDKDRFDGIECHSVKREVVRK